MFCTCKLFGQDLIITNSKEELKTKVIEIDELFVKYKKFDFQDGPTYSIKKSDVFLIIYSNGTREAFNQSEVTKMNPETQLPGRKHYSEKEEINTTTPINSAKNYASPNQGNLDNRSNPGSNSFLFNDGDEFLGIGLGTGVLVGASSSFALVNIPYISVRFDKVYFQVGENMALGAGLYTAYHSYSIGDFGNESIFNVISAGLSGSYYYNISEKLALGAGVRILYVTIATTGSFGYTIDPVSDVDLLVYASAYYKVAKKLNLFSELSSGISTINLGCQFNF